MCVYFEDSVPFSYSTAVLKVWSRSTKLEEWGNENFRKFNKSKCKVWQLGQGNPRHKYGMGEELIESIPAEKELDVLVDEKLNMNQECVLIDQTANSIPSWIKSSVASRPREMILPHCSALVTSHREYLIQLWNARHKRNEGLLEWVWRAVAKMS